MVVCFGLPRRSNHGVTNVHGVDRMFRESNHTVYPNKSKGVQLFNFEDPFFILRISILVIVESWMDGIKGG